MALESSGNLSIKTAAGSNRSIDTAVTSVSSGSLVTLSQNAIGSLSTAPYGMLEFYGYAHTWDTTGTVAESTVGKGSYIYTLNLVDNTPDNAGGQITQIISYPGGSGMRVFWLTSRNDNWTNLLIGSSSSSYTTIARSSMSTGTTQHYISGSTYITNTNNASMYFSLTT